MVHQSNAAKCALCQFRCCFAFYMLVSRIAAVAPALSLPHELGVWVGAMAEESLGEGQTLRWLLHLFLFCARPPWLVAPSLCPLKGMDVALSPTPCHILDSRMCTTYVGKPTHSSPYLLRTAPWCTPKETVRFASLLHKNCSRTWGDGAHFEIKEK